MTKEDTYKKLIIEIVDLYRSARNTIFPDRKIRRGRSHSISANVEDLFGKFLVENIDCDFIFIDQPITVVGIKGTHYPDLVVVKDQQIIGTCDIKMDMGWNRDGLVELCENGSNYIKATQGKMCKLTNGLDKQVFEFEISTHCFHNIIIISDLNNNKTRFSEQVKQVELFKPFVNVFVLTSGKHLNSYNIETMELIKSIEIRFSEFDKLLDSFSNNSTQNIA